MHKRFRERFPAVAPAILEFEFLIPLVHVNNHKENCVYKHSCSYVESAGHFHGETAEHEWAELNQVATQTRQMNNGHRQDVLIDHHSDWNWKKVVNMGTSWSSLLSISICLTAIKYLTSLTAATLSNEVVHDRMIFSQKREQFLGLAAVFSEHVSVWNMEDRTLRKMNPRTKEIECVYRHRQSKGCYFPLICTLCKISHDACPIVPTQKKLFAELLSKTRTEDTISADQSDSRTRARSTLQVTFINEGLYIEQDQYVFLFYIEGHYQIFDIQTRNFTGFIRD